MKTIYYGSILVLMVTLQGCLPEDDGKGYSISDFTATYYDNGVLVTSEVVESPSINYAWSDFNNISSPNFSASWVGEITVPEKEVQAIDINFALSWSEVELLINGVLVDAWSNGDKSIHYQFMKGTNTIEIRYENNWHTVGFNTTFTTNEEHDFAAAALLIEPLLTPEDSIIYVGAYEANSTYNKINVTLSQYSTPVFLFLSSYDSVNWVVDNPNNVEIKGIVYGSYSPRSVVSITTDNTVSLIEVEGLRFGYEGREGNIISFENGVPVYEDGNFSAPISDIITLAGRAPDYMYGEYALGDISIPASDEPTAGVVVLDTFDDLNRNGGFIMSPSKISGSQSVSMFDIDGEKSITNIKWSGSVNDHVNIDSAQFIIRLFKGDLRPEDDVYKEIFVVSSATKVAIDGFNNYHFSIDLDGELIVEQGRYWLSVVDPETEGLGFAWSMEKDKLSTIYGSGGAFRASDLSAWQSPNSGVVMTDARGRSLSITVAE